MNNGSTEKLHRTFRTVPRTGVIYVMHEARAAGLEDEPEAWSNLGQGAPETGPLPGAPERLRKLELDDEVYEYGPIAGLTRVREAVAELYNTRYRRGMPSRYTAENVAIASGGRAGLTRVVAALDNVNLGHLLPDYTAYEELLEVFRSFVPIPVVVRADQAFRLAPDEMRAEVVAKGLGGLLLSNPCNPTGNVVLGEELRAWVAACRETSCFLIADEFYSHYLYDVDFTGRNGPSESACRYVEDVDADPVLVLDGLTKNWRYPGLRLSWTLGPKKVIERVTSAGSFLDGGPAHHTQKAALQLLDPAVADAEASAIQATFREKRQFLMEEVRQLGLGLHTAPAGAFYCFVSLSGLPEPINDGMAFFRAALKRKVIVIPGVFFDVNPGKRRSHIPSRLKNYVRLSFGPPMDELRRGMHQLRALIEEARG